MKLKRRTQTTSMNHRLSLIALLMVTLFASAMPAWADNIAEGTSGTCKWTIDAEGYLYVVPSEGTSGTLAEWTTAPWDEYKDKIILVLINSKTNEIHIKNCEGLFSGYTKLQQAILTDLRTDDVTSMKDMFQGCDKLWNLDLSSFNTSNVTDMSGMFKNCPELWELNINSFDTGNVTNMDGMFQNCQMGSLYLGNFTNVNASIEDLFTGSSRLSYLYINREVPPNIQNGTFDTLANKDVGLTVPDGCKEAYFSIPIWYQFSDEGRFYIFNTNESIWEEFNSSDMKSNMEEILYSDEFELNYETLKFSDFLAYPSIIEYLSTRDSLRIKYDAFYQEMYNKYMAGELCSYSNIDGYRERQMFLIQEIYELRNSIYDNFEMDYYSHKYRFIFDPETCGKYLIRHDTYDNNIKTYWESYHYDKDNEPGYVAYRFFQDEGIVKYKLTFPVNEKYSMVPGSWFLYGYNNTGGETPDYYDLDKWTCIDSRENTKDLTPGVAHEFTIKNPGIYNRFMFGFYKPDNLNYDDSWYYLGLAEVDFVEGELPEGMTANVPDPVIPKFTAILNEGKHDEYYKKVQIASTIGQGGSNLRWLNGGRVNVVYKHVDPQYGIKNHHTFIHPTAFDSDGLLEFELYDEARQSVLFNAETFPQVKGHACDIIITGQAIGTLTGKTYNVCDTIPYYIGGYTAPEVFAEKNTVWGTKATSLGKYTAEVKDVDLLHDFTINVEVEDYESGSYAKRNLSYTYTHDQYSKYFNTDYWEELVPVEENDWVKLLYNYDMRSKTGGMGVAKLFIPITCLEGGNDVKVKITATNHYGEESGSGSSTAEYIRFSVDDYFKGSYVTGKDHKSDPEDISQWRTSNKQEMDQMENCFKSGKSSSETVAAINAFAESCIREISYSAPAGWGTPYIYMPGNDYGYEGQAGNGKIYVHYGCKEGEQQSFKVVWPDVDAEKTFSFTPHTIQYGKSPYYAFRILTEDESEMQSITLDYYADSPENKIPFVNTKGEHKQKTLTGNFSMYSDNPDYFFLYEPNRIAYYSPITVRNNSAQSIATANIWKLCDKTIQSIYPHSTENMWASFSPIDAYTNTYLDVLSPEFIVENTQTVQLMILDEKGQPFDAPHIQVCYIKQKPGEPMELGTSPTHNPFTKPIKLTEYDSATGLVEFSIPKSDDGTIYHPIIEVTTWQGHYDFHDYTPRIISEFTDPDAFLNYINKGLPYPCVMEKTTNGKELYIRPKDSPIFGSDSQHFNSHYRSEHSYVGDSESLDILTVTSNQINESERDNGPERVLADGTSEKGWPFTCTYKLVGVHNGREWKSGGYNYSTHTWNPSGMYYKSEFMDDVEVASDELGREIYWPREYTGFIDDFILFTSTPSYMVLPMYQGETKPKSDQILLAGFKPEYINEDGTIKFPASTAHAKWMGKFYNKMQDNTDYHAYLQGVMNHKTEGWNADAVSKDKKLKKVEDAWDGLSVSTPSCVPFFKILVTREKNIHRIRSCFEFNALDAIPLYSQYSELKGYVEDASSYITEFSRLKNHIGGDYVCNATDDSSDGFIGFKGFAEMSLVYNPVTGKTTPYFTGFGVSAEASANLFWTLNATPFVAKMSTQFEFSSSFMILNPHPKDYILGLAKNDPDEPVSRSDFEPMSNYNLYLGSTFDISLKLQAGIGFDAGFIAAHGGIQGKARAAMRSAIVKRPYMNNEVYKTSAGYRFDANVSLSAYAYFKFLFIKYTKEWPICSAGITHYIPDGDLNPMKSDPNLNDELLENSSAKVRTRALSTTYRPGKRRVSVIGERVISDQVDIFANPMYLNGGRRLAFLNINDPANANDDRVMISGDNCNVNTGSQDLYEDQVPAFTYNAASAGEHQIIAVQRLAQQLKAGDDDMDAAANLTNKLQIVASIGEESSDDYEPTVISTEGSANTDPKAAIAQNGNAAVVWASGDITVNEEDDGEGGTYSDPCMNGNIVISQYKDYSWSKPVALVPTSKSSQVKDYAVAIGNKLPLVIASVPSVDDKGQATAPTFLYTLNNGFTHRTALGYEGSMHQLVAVYDNNSESTNHFIASSLVNIDDKGNTDIQLYDIKVNDNGTATFSSLGKLGLSRNRLLSYRLVSPKEGATDVDGLGVIWNEHEQVNTDDETLEAIAYNRTYVARINRRGDYVYLSHAAQALGLDDAHSVADMTAYMDYDSKLKCPVVTAAFCVGETQTGNASSAAQLIEKKVSLNNEIEWIEAESGLAGNISRTKGADIKLTLRNKGLHTIKKFTVTTGTESKPVVSEHSVNLAPSSKTTITVHLPGNTNYDNDVSFKVKADFYNIDITNAEDAGEFTESVEINGSVKINVTDMCLGVSTNYIDTIANKTLVNISVANLSPMALKAGNHVKVSLFTDAMGDTQYNNVGTYDIPVSALYNSETRRNLVKTVHFALNTPENRTIVYAVCRTLDAEDNVVFDQNSSDNAVAVMLMPSNYETEGEDNTTTLTVEQLAKLVAALNDGKTTADMDYDDNSIIDINDVYALRDKLLAIIPDRLSVSDLQNPRLKVRNQGENVVVEGLNAAKDVKIFDANGRLIKWTEPNSEKATISVKRKGQLIIVNDGKAGVIRH